MILYEFECGCGHIQEEVLSIDRRNDFVRCDACGAQTTRLICSHIERVEPTYLDEMKHQLHPRDRGRVTDRHSWNKVLKEKGLVTV